MELEEENRALTGKLSTMTIELERGASDLEVVHEGLGNLNVQMLAVQGVCDELSNELRTVEESKAQLSNEVSSTVGLCVDHEQQSHFHLYMSL